MTEYGAAGEPTLDQQISCEFVASLLCLQSVWAVLMSFFTIAAGYNGAIELSHAHIDDDMADCGASVVLLAGQPTLTCEGFDILA